MRRGVFIALAAFVAFLLVILARFPAQWAAAFLPAQLTCQQLTGTLWNGGCSGLAMSGQALGDLDWRLHPLALLAARLDADVQWTPAGGSAQGHISLRPGGALSAQGARAHLALTHELVASIPPGSRGVLDAELRRLEWDGHRVRSVEGVIEAHQLATPMLMLGDYRLTFPTPSAAEPVGELHDLGGPLDLTGTLRLTGEPGWVLDTRLKARPGAPADLVQALRYLGTPDGSGRVPFSVAGTF